ncbi:MAG: E1-like protein-activating enzyme Gsa7p/Apg7p [Benjaminiella poitrasii]|nr:MAG: E1-like protein-activating enzyme Gsa7p/Apg7p [Benjaminiella poitrasii]
MSSSILKFTPLSSAVDASFWRSLVSKKLNVLGLSDESQAIHGYYTTGQSALDEQENKSIMIQSHFTVPADGLSDIKANFFLKQNTSKIGLYSKGMLVNTNTIEEFRKLDKNKLFQQTTERIINSVKNGEALKDSNLLNSFLLVTFADLKKYKFYYWFAFPAIMPQPTPWVLTETCNKELQPVQMHFSDTQLDCLDKGYQALENNPSYFLIQKEEKTGKIRVSALSEFDNDDNCIFGFIDPSVSTDAPGWPLRNLLYLISKIWNKRKVKVVCYRPHKKNHLTSYFLETELPETSSYDFGFIHPICFYINKAIKSVGWERNVQGKLGPRMADLGPLMDPMRLADTSVDLNLKLMRWRLMPELDLEKIKQTKCLLFGAGTLGCYVARCLIGWGIRHITFVDNGKVSFSNPVRQPLYNFEDALNGGSSKAETAAENLKKIQPTIDATGINVSIPMPGHPSDSDEQLTHQIETLTNLVENHDVIFLLTDSRESRWYPTLLGARKNKIVLNSALGFDTYLVMRHGSRQNQDKKDQLGCYFCNDIVAPTDSLTDRTLDQQCTVTRPGLAAIAGALSVELMVSLLQHPEGIHAKPDTSQALSILGLLPHQIRGFLGQFNNMLIVGQAYERCTACSDKVIISEYNMGPLSLMKRVLEDPLYLEEITGLAAMKKESEALMNEWDEIDDEDDDLN